MKILIAEDDIVSRKLLQASLEKRGYEVVPTTNGREAWKILQQDEAPQLAILDWMMPEMDGVEVIRKVREENPEAYKYLILLTAKSQKDDIALGLDTGADDYLIKPFNPKELHARVEVGKRMVDLHNQLEGHIKGLQELDKLKSDFLSMVSHELRTPLAVMKGGVTLCLDEIPGKLNETQKDLLQDTLDNINQLTRLITDLLDMSKIEAGKVTLHKDFFDLSALVQKIHKTFSSEAEKKSITLNLDYQEREAPVYADRDKVIQIFYNLVSNAMRYTKAGGSVTLTVREEKKEYICSVVDTGVGISRENMEKLFSKFEQFGRVDGPGYKGTGLGLTIAKGLVEKHGGRIWAKSKLGTGTTFFFTLKKMDNPSILAVGDERQVVKQVENSLNHKGFNFIEAYNGEEAFLKPRSDRPA